MVESEIPNGCKVLSVGDKSAESSGSCAAETVVLII